MTMTKDSYQFGIEPVRITDTDNIQVNEGLPTNADPQVYALALAKAVKTMLNGVLKSAQDNIPFPIEILPTRNSLPTPIIAHTLADRSVVVPVRGGKRPEVVLRLVLKSPLSRLSKLSSCPTRPSYGTLSLPLVSLRGRSSRTL